MATLTIVLSVALSTMLIVYLTNRSPLHTKITSTNSIYPMSLIFLVVPVERLVNYVAYHCVEYRCNIIVCVKCVLLPTIVNRESHPHPLNLTAQMLEASCCNVCSKGRECKRWAYYCVDCKFIAHMSCICEGSPSPYMKSGETALKHPIHEIESKVVYQCFKFIYNLDLGCALRLIYAIQLYSIPEEEERGEEEEREVSEMPLGLELVNHFSHLQPLALLDEQTSVERCNGCRLAISDSGPQIVNFLFTNLSGIASSNYVPTTPSTPSQPISGPSTTFQQWHLLLYCLCHSWQWFLLQLRRMQVCHPCSLCFTYTSGN